MDLGQINALSTLKLITKLNKKTTGLSDVLIDIYRPDDTKVVNNGEMTEVGTTGIYEYSFGIPRLFGTFLAVISCASQRNYDEIQTFTSIQAPGAGGGMVVQYPAKVIDKKEQKRRKALKELMIAIDIKLTALIKKDPKIDFTKVNNEIKRRTKELEDNMKILLDKKEDLSNKGLEKISLQNKKDKELLRQRVADFTDKIYQLQENTKLLPNSLNSLLTSAESSTISKFKEMEYLIKNNFNRINTQTSKFNDGVMTSSEKLNRRFGEFETKLVGQIDIIPKSISIQIENIKKKLNENTNSINNSLLDYKKSSEENIQRFITNIDKIKTVLDNLDSKSLKNIGNGLDNIIWIIKEIKENNIQGFKNVEKNLTKIPTRRDLNYTQEITAEKIKEAQSNNTKKVKILRDNIEEISKKVKETKQEQEKNRKDLIKKIEVSEEESAVNAQLAILNEGENA